MVPSSEGIDRQDQPTVWISPDAEIDEKESIMKTPAQYRTRMIQGMLSYVSVSVLLMGLAYAQVEKDPAKPQRVATASPENKEPEQITKKSEPVSRTGGWHLQLEAVTSMPVDMGGRLTLEMPGRIRLATSFGVMPFFYADFVNAIGTGVGLYDQQTALVLKNTLQNSFVWRLNLEWRPFAGAGFYLGGGYGLVVLNSKLTGASLAGMSLGIPSSSLSLVNFQLNSMLHLLNGELGWEFRFLRDVMSLRLAVGFIGTVASNTKIQTQVSSSVPAQIRTTITNGANTAASAFDTMYRSYIFSPTVSVAMGFRFF